MAGRQGRWVWLKVYPDDKPGQRHLAHYGVVIELERERRFVWRAPFSEWNKVWIGTDMQLTRRPDGGSHAYHVLAVDMPREYLAVFGGFGRLHGFDIEFETFHIQEEIRGFNELPRNGGFSEEQRQYLFDEDRVLAVDVPMDKGRPYPYPDEILTLKADTVLTYEEAAVVTAEMLAEAIETGRRGPLRLGCLLSGSSGPTGYVADDDKQFLRASLKNGLALLRLLAGQAAQAIEAGQKEK